MDEQGSKGPRGEVFTKTIRAGKRTYFFDVKTTRSKEFYLTITESKKRFNQQSGKFYYEKHKVFLYPEDFEKFSNALQEAFSFIEKSDPEDYAVETPGLHDVKFEDLDKEKPGQPDEDDSKKEGDKPEDLKEEKKEDAKSEEEEKKGEEGEEGEEKKE